MILGKVKMMALSTPGASIRKEQKERRRFFYLNLNCSCFIKLHIYILRIILKHECYICLLLPFSSSALDHNGKKATNGKWSVLLLERDEIGRGLCHLRTFTFSLVTEGFVVFA